MWSRSSDFKLVYLLFLHSTMAHKIFYHIFVLTVIFQSSLSQRRIKDGLDVVSDKHYVLLNNRIDNSSALSQCALYAPAREVRARALRRGRPPLLAPLAPPQTATSRHAPTHHALALINELILHHPEVYLLRATSAEHDYYGWLCGGAILSKDYVITSAACVQDVKHLYVVPGYKKYVSTEKMDEDECVKQKKKKVILTCVPRNYQFEFNRTEMWARIDIAIIKMESSFDFEDQSYETVCSYIPKPIEYNTEKEFPKVGDDVVVFGWGHKKEFRKDTERNDMNQATLMYAPTRVLAGDLCYNYYKGNKDLAAFIESSMLCTLEPGKLDDRGELIGGRSKPSAQGCISEAARSRGAIGEICEDEIREDDMIYDYIPDGPLVYEDRNGEVMVINDTTRLRRRFARRQNYEEVDIQPQKNEDGTESVIDSLRQGPEEESSSAEHDGEHTPGICQNDHGGPLVSWRGGKEILVAVATLFKLDRQYRCMGPYLFTKTWCNGAFIQCIVDQKAPGMDGRRDCDDPKEIGFEIVRRHISWVGHRDGPAYNERIQIRHQVPMSAFQPKRKKRQLTGYWNTTPDYL